MGENLIWVPVPIRTHLITQEDDIVEVVLRYTSSAAEPGDIIVIAESPVAISQGRAFLSSSVKSGLLARFLCKFPNKDGSLATPQAMQLAINEVGMLRVLMGAVAAAFGKALGRSGDFYRVAGKELAKIDDIAGTLPPFDRYIVLGPKNPQKITDEIYKKTGIATVIAEINDIGCVDILAVSGKVSEKQLTEILKHNPFGNDDQQTPIVILKKTNKGG
ncbi:MAG TPA: coenzyme F420-0:L-glutamate ligase [Tepidanaerobacteraceae bacterium]|nr:coenzyme F420-0:L-glutamate ligase [Tepidanaerobacteraceae bacterium]